MEAKAIYLVDVTEVGSPRCHDKLRMKLVGANLTISYNLMSLSLRPVLDDHIQLRPGYVDTLYQFHRSVRSEVRILENLHLGFEPKYRTPIETHGGRC